MDIAYKEEHTVKSSSRPAGPPGASAGPQTTKLTKLLKQLINDIIIIKQLDKFILEECRGVKDIAGFFCYSVTESDVNEI